MTTPRLNFPIEVSVRPGWRSLVEDISDAYYALGEDTTSPSDAVYTIRDRRDGRTVTGRLGEFHA